MQKTKVEKHFDVVAQGYDLGKRKYFYYYEYLKELLSSLIPVGEKVFEIGCGTGDLLASLKPKYGYGMDISKQMIKNANNKYANNSNLKFSIIWPFGHFEYIFMSDVIEHMDEPEKEFSKIVKLMRPSTIFINTMANPIWEPLLMVWESLGWKMKEGPHYRIKNYELRIIMERQGLRIIKHDYKLLIPIKIPFITGFANKYLENYLKPLCFIEYFVAVKR